MLSRKDFSSYFLFKVLFILYISKYKGIIKYENGFENYKKILKVIKQGV